MYERGGRPTYTAEIPFNFPFVAPVCTTTLSPGQPTQ